MSSLYWCSDLYHGPAPHHLQHCSTAVLGCSFPPSETDQETWRPVWPLQCRGGGWLWCLKSWQWNNNFLVLHLAGIFMQDSGLRSEKSRQILNPQRPQRFIIKYVRPGLHTTSQAVRRKIKLRKHFKLGFCSELSRITHSSRDPHGYWVEYH